MGVPSMSGAQIETAMRERGGREINELEGSILWASSDLRLIPLASRVKSPIAINRLDVYGESRP